MAEISAFAFAAVWLCTGTIALLLAASCPFPTRRCGGNFLLSASFCLEGLSAGWNNCSLIVTASFIGGGLLGWISYYIYAALLNWTGKWIKGQGDTKSILRIISYALTPSIIALIFLIPQIGIYGNEMFKSDGDIVSAGLVANIFVYGSLILEFILGIWTIVFCVVGVSEVQKLSIGKAILNLLLPLLVFAIPIIIIVLIFQAV